MTGAVLTRRMGNYKEVDSTKLLQIIPFDDTIAENGHQDPMIILISSIIKCYDLFTICKKNYFASVHSPIQDCTLSPTL